MRLEDYGADLLRRLHDPDYAAGYLEAVLAREDNETFLLALRNVIEALGGLGSFAKQVSLSRQSLYKITSRTGNPSLNALREILKPIGLRISVKPIRDEA